MRKTNYKICGGETATSGADRSSAQADMMRLLLQTAIMSTANHASQQGAPLPSHTLPQKTEIAISVLPFALPFIRPKTEIAISLLSGVEIPISIKRRSIAPSALPPRSSVEIRENSVTEIYPSHHEEYGD